MNDNGTTGERVALVASLAVAVLAVVLLDRWFMTLDVRVDQADVVASFGPFRKRVQRVDIREASSPPYEWLKYGGWGLRYGFRRRRACTVPFLRTGIGIGLGVWIAVGMLLPWYSLRARTCTRTREIDRSLSDAIDLIVTNIEAGVGLQAALINVSQKFSGRISVEISRTIREIGLGRANQDALEAMGRRSGSREMALLARAVAQAERNGIPIARVLRSQTDELRERRRQQARERANTFPVRITLITVLFIFPSLFMMFLGQVVLDVLDYFNG